MNEMGADEIIDWMAYEISQNPDFVERINKTPVSYDNPEDEAAAIRKMLIGLQK